MLAELHRCPNLFATTADSCSVMAKMNKYANKLLVCVFTLCGESYLDEFDEAGLANVKATHEEKCSWVSFFSTLRESFNNNRLTVERVTDDFVNVVCPIVENNDRIMQIKGRMLFHVGKKDTDVLPIIVEGLIHTHQLQTYPKCKEQELKQMTEEIAQLKVRIDQFEKEIRVQNESDTKQRNIHGYVSKQKEDLLKKIAEAEKSNKNSNGHAGKTTTNHSTNTENNVFTFKRCPIRQPLGDKECKPYDLDLLRYIKGRWMTKDDIKDNLSKHVVIPISLSELQKRNFSFAKKEHEVILNALDKIDEWDYNVFNIQTCMCGDDFASLSNQPNGGSFFITMYALLIKYKFLSIFNIDEQIALNWISNVEAGYYGNPYHNSMHAADVVHVTHYILSCGGMKERCNLSDLQVFAALMAAAIHDYGHPGVNNTFHIKTQSYSAILYNDRSVLENNHLSSAFELMRNPRCNILQSFSEDQVREIRDTVIDMVLATDMGLHETFLERFKCRLAQHVSFTDTDDQRLALSIALKMADISNCARPREIYIKWCTKVSDEFYLQGDRERNMGFECSPFMNRLKPDLPKGQISFISYIIIPFFEPFAAFLPRMRFMLYYVDECKKHWSAEGNNGH